jgi:DNA-directed RNA polymerase subunit RPC12/RpoP
MYHTLKQITKFLIPKSIIFSIEPALRWVVYKSKYQGQKYQCNICGSKLKSFVDVTSNGLLCPRCGSLGRDRRLYTVEKKHFVGKTKILDFSPSRCLYRMHSRTPNILYTSSDFGNNFIANQKYDITKIPLPDDSFEIIICYHILEHIDNDIIAM